MTSMVGPTSSTRERPARPTHFARTDGKLLHIDTYLDCSNRTIGYSGTLSSYFSETEPAMTPRFLNVLHLDLLR